MTPFTNLYRPLQTLLGDIYSVPSYASSMLDRGISLALYDEYPKFQESTDVSGNSFITPDLTVPDYQRIAIRSALALMRPQQDEGGYRTPMLSVNKRNSIAYEDLKGALQDILNGGINVVVGDNEFDQAFNGITTVPGLLARFGITSSTLVNWGNNQTAYPNG